MERFSVLHRPPLPSIQPRLPLRNAVAPPAAIDLRGAKSRRRKGGRRRRTAIWPSIDAEALRRAAVSLATNLLGPPRREPLDLLFLLGGDGGSMGGGRRGFWGGSGGGGWFGGWGRRRRGREMVELLLSMAVAAVLGMTPEKELTAGMTLLGLKNKNKAWRRGIGAVALAFLVCFLAWRGLRRRRNGRLKWGYRPW
ncbi:hypothetical protein Cni_G04693 [Canna indica]|uniref:Uncharacterized protein n=1 Tax=Canna indica TaxID=4628 RepID=A0AAQ3JTZ5_9LILI|nr:hypothetical protein Cni_G04693 [Canna indica]